MVRSFHRRVGNSPTRFHVTATSEPLAINPGGASKWRGERRAFDCVGAVGLANRTTRPSGSSPQGEVAQGRMVSKYPLPTIPAAGTHHGHLTDPDKEPTAARGSQNQTLMVRDCAILRLQKQ